MSQRGREEFDEGKRKGRDNKVNPLLGTCVRAEETISGQAFLCSGSQNKKLHIFVDKKRPERTASERSPKKEGPVPGAVKMEGVVR